MAIGQLYISPFSGKTDGACRRAADWQARTAAPRAVGPSPRASLSKVQNSSIKRTIEFYEKQSAPAGSKMGRAIAGVGNDHRGSAASRYQQGSASARGAVDVARCRKTVMTQASQATQMQLPHATPTLRQQAMQAETSIETAPAATQTAEAVSTMPKTLVREALTSRLGAKERDEGDESLGKNPKPVVPMHKDPSVLHTKLAFYPHPEPYLGDNPITSKAMTPERIALNREKKMARLVKNRQSSDRAIESIKKHQTTYLELLRADTPKRIKKGRRPMPFPEKMPRFAVTPVRDNDLKIDGKSTARRTGYVKVSIEEIHRQNEIHNALRASYVQQAVHAAGEKPTEASSSQRQHAASTGPYSGAVANVDIAKSKQKGLNNASDSGIESDDETSQSGGRNSAMTYSRAESCATDFDSDVPLSDRDLLTNDRQLSPSASFDLRRPLSTISVADESAEPQKEEIESIDSSVAKVQKALEAIRREDAELQEKAESLKNEYEEMISDLNRLEPVADDCLVASTRNKPRARAGSDSSGPVSAKLRERLRQQAESGIKASFMVKPS